MAVEISDCGCEEGAGTGCILGGEDVEKADAGGIIDTDVSFCVKSIPLVPK